MTVSIYLKPNKQNHLNLLRINIVSKTEREDDALLLFSSSYKLESIKL